MNQGMSENNFWRTASKDVGISVLQQHENEFFTTTWRSLAVYSSPKHPKSSTPNTLFGLVKREKQRNSRAMLSLDLQPTELWDNKKMLF